MDWRELGRADRQVVNCRSGKPSYRTYLEEGSAMRNNSQSDWQPNRIGIISCPRRLLLVARCSICRSRPASCNRLQSREYFLRGCRGGAARRGELETLLFLSSEGVTGFKSLIFRSLSRRPDERKRVTQLPSTTQSWTLLNRIESRYFEDFAVEESLEHI